MRVGPLRLDPEQLRVLLIKIASKDVQAFHDLYDATAEKLLRFALRILRQTELAEEVLQESYSSIWLNACDYRSDRSAPMTWMTAVVRNKAYDVMRDPNFSIHLLSDPLDEIALNEIIDPRCTPMISLELRREAAALVACLSQLENRQREVIIMAFFQDLSHSEIACSLALPIGTVKTWIRRGMGHLQMSLKHHEIMNSAG